MPFPDTHPALARALAERGYDEPTPVQAAVLEPDAAGRDLLVSAQTGSGKTVAFGLAVAPTLLGDAERFTQAGAPLALVVAPTRELAMQVHRELSWLYAPTGAQVIACVGGMDARREQRALQAGAHIVVGTPGRLRDHLERGQLDVSGLRVLILDEADEMLDLGFREDLEFMLDATPVERRTLLFSATIARDIASLAKRYQRNALRIDTTVSNEPHGDIDYRALAVAPNDIEHAVVNVLRFYDAPGALVFCSTREAVKRLHARLVERGFEAVALSGEMGQSERTSALQALRDGRARVCVATDVAARGLDLPELNLVVHADLPVNRAGLLHRSGRTGRAGRKGTSIVLVGHNRRRKADMLFTSAGIEATWESPPTPDAIRKRDQERLLEDPILTGELAEDERELAQALLAGRAPEDIAAALIRLYRSRLPSPEELFDPGPPRRDAGERQGREEWTPRPERADRPGPDDVVWFRLNLGRNKNANPKWLVPLICRLGHVTKPEIGAIRIFDKETKFEIIKPVAERFAAAAALTVEDDIKITPAGAPAARDDKPFKPRPAYASKGQGAPGRKPNDAQAFGDKKPFEKKPYEKKAYEKKPYEKKPYDPAAPKPRADKPYAKKPFAKGKPARP
jgi:ATP-dependent RNA helicase DeaD